VLGLATHIVKHRFINSFIIFLLQLMVNGSLLSHGSFVLTYKFTALKFASDLSGPGTQIILSTTNIKLSHVRNKLPHLKF